MSGKWTARDIPSLTDKTAIVTGASSGLGLETSAGLANAGAHVVMACRNPVKAQSSLDEVRLRAPRARVEVMALDLADLSSVRRFADEFAKRNASLDILCNNAGVMGVPFQKTRDGFEMQIGTNHLGHFALTGLLFERLRAAPGARVVTVASVAHRTTRGLNIDDLHWERTPYRKGDAYAKSKLANLLFSFELGRRLSRAGMPILAAAAHPGYSDTNIVGAASEGSAIKRLLVRIGGAVIAQPANLGALPTLHAATMPDVRSGDYIGPDGPFEFRGYPKKVGCKRIASCPETAARLWALSEQLTGVRFLSNA
jgi:NAD(P)-dependent dehydrogenase (short-subunit alcohol dehydrogenase family)